MRRADAVQAVEANDVTASRYRSGGGIEPRCVGTIRACRRGALWLRAWAWSDSEVVGDEKGRVISVLVNSAEDRWVAAEAVEKVVFERSRE